MGNEMQDKNMSNANTISLAKLKGKLGTEGGT